MAVVASFTADVVEGAEPLVVTFTDTSIGSPNKWFWTFGDGAVSEDQHPVHTYTEIGIYSVTLKAFIQTGSSDVTVAYENFRFKGSGSRVATNAAAHALLLSTSWTLHAGSASFGSSYDVDRNDGSGGYTYSQFERKYKFDLTGFSSGVAIFEVAFSSSADVVESGVVFDSGGAVLAATPFGTFFPAGDISSGIGTNFETIGRDIDGGLNQLGDPPDNQRQGWIQGSTAFARARVYTSSDDDAELKINFISVGIQAVVSDPIVVNDVNNLLIPALVPKVFDTINVAEFVKAQPFPILLNDTIKVKSVVDLLVYPIPYFRRWDLLKCYIDEIPGWKLDDGRFLDCQQDEEFVLEAECSLAVFRYRGHETLDMEIEFECEDVSTFKKFIDLLQLVPECLRDSDILKDYVKEVGVIVGTILSDIDALPKLHDPNAVGLQFIDHLAALIALDFVRIDDTSLQDLRNQLEQAIDWYKIKGSYESLEVAARLNAFNVVIWDFYTNDYVTFVKQAWFVGDEGENPPGLDSTYYKSPHFGFQVLLDTVYGTAPNEYLWKSDFDTKVRSLVEGLRPINTVPHYIIHLDSIAWEDGLVNITDAKVRTVVTGSWSWSAMYLDMGAELGSSFFWNLDSGERLDSSDTAFLNSIDKYKLGIGNKNVSPDDSGFALETVVILGNIDVTTLYGNRTEYDIIIPEATVQLGISELGLFLSDNTTLQVACTFPDVDKSSGTELTIKVTIFK